MRAVLPSLLAALALATPALATDSIRCGQDLVQEGESAAYLLLTCGEPMLRQVVSEPGSESDAPVVELWIYDFGSGTLLQLVTLEGGRVVRVEDGERR